MPAAIPGRSPGNPGRSARLCPGRSARTTCRTQCWQQSSGRFPGAPGRSSQTTCRTQCRLLSPGRSPGPAGDLHGPLAVRNAGSIPGAIPGGPRAICTALPWNTSYLSAIVLMIVLPLCLSLNLFFVDDLRLRVKSPGVFFWKRLRTRHKGGRFPAAPGRSTRKTFPLPSPPSQYCSPPSRARLKPRRQQKLMQTHEL